MTTQELIEKYEDKLKDVQLKFGASFKTKVYEELIEDLKQLDEPQKVKIPHFVADWIEVCKEHLTHSLYTAMTPNFMKENGQSLDLILWIKKASNQDIFARAWLDGYEVEKEKRYTIRFKNIRKETRYLKYDRVVENWYFGVEQCSKETKISHTRTELEEAGFGWVFDCEGIEIEEVE